MKKVRFGHVQNHPKNGQNGFGACLKTYKKRAKGVLVVSENGYKTGKNHLGHSV